MRGWNNERICRKKGIDIPNTKMTLFSLDMDIYAVNTPHTNRDLAIVPISDQNEINASTLYQIKLTIC